MRVFSGDNEQDDRDYEGFSLIFLEPGKMKEEREKARIIWTLGESIKQKLV